MPLIHIWGTCEITAIYLTADYFAVVSNKVIPTIKIFLDPQTSSLGSPDLMGTPDESVDAPQWLARMNSLFAVTRRGSIFCK